jgi:hypothetical protein
LLFFKFVNALLQLLDLLFEGVGVITLGEGCRAPDEQGTSQQRYHDPFLHRVYPLGGLFSSGLRYSQIRKPINAKTIRLRITSIRWFKPINAPLI